MTNFFLFLSPYVVNKVYKEPALKCCFYFKTILKNQQFKTNELIKVLICVNEFVVSNKANWEKTQQLRQ